MLIKNKIIILCGGKGSRLGKLTRDVPKPLIKIRNKPILQYKLDYYKKNGFDDYVFCTGYKGDIIKDYVSKKGMDSKISHMGNDAGILERIFNAREFFSEPAIISYGDTYAEINFKDLIKKHNISNSLITLVTAFIKNPFGLLNIDKKNKVSSFVEKPLLNHYIGYAVFSPEIFDKIPKSYINLPDGSGVVKMINYLSKKKLVNAYKFDGLQITVNNSMELTEASKTIGKYYTIKDKNEK